MKRSIESTQNQAVLVSFTKKQYERAVARSKEHPDRSGDPRSITRGRGLITGCLGEIIVEDFLEHVKACDDDKRAMKDKYNFDVLLDDGTTLEVKSKGHGVSDCPSFYDCSVSAINPRQKADYYVFVRIHGRRIKGSYGFDHSQSSKAWICGIKAKEDMIKPERLMKRGTVVKNSSNFDYVAKSSCYQIKISELEPLRKDIGERMDLISSGRIEFENKTFFGLQSEEDEYFMTVFGKVDRNCGYFKGLSDLTARERKHFDENLDTYLFYNEMVSDTSKLELAKEQGKWSVKHLKIVV